MKKKRKGTPKVFKGGGVGGPRVWDFLFRFLEDTRTGLPMCGWKGDVDTPWGGCGCTTRLVVLGLRITNIGDERRSLSLTGIEGGRCVWLGTFSSVCVSSSLSSPNNVEHTPALFLPLWN